MNLMKMQSIIMLKTVVKMSPLLLCITIGSCQQREQPATPSTGKVTAEAPKVDIHTAVVSGDLNTVKQHIAAGSNINEKDPFGGSSPLISAAVFGKTDIAKVLLDAGADIDFQNNDGSTALHSAAFFLPHRYC